MLKLLVCDTTNSEYLAIKAFLNFLAIELPIEVDCDMVRTLSSDKKTVLLMENDMIICRGFYDIVDYIKNVYNHNKIVACEE